VSQKPNSIQRSIWPFEKKNFPDRKKQYQHSDVSRLCSLIASRTMSGKLPDATTGSCSILRYLAAPDRDFHCQWEWTDWSNDL